MLLQGFLAVLCGSLVGFTLGLIGSGGSIMARPLHGFQGTPGFKADATFAAR